MTPKHNQELQQLLEQHLTAALKQFVHESLTPNLMNRIRTTVKKTIDNVISRTQDKLSDKGIMWLTDQYFKGIKMNDDLLMSDQVVINEYKLSELEFSDIELLYGMYDGTDLGIELEKEYHKRMLNMS